MPVPVSQSMLQEFILIWICGIKKKKEKEKGGIIKSIHFCFHGIKEKKNNKARFTVPDKCGIFFAWIYYRFGAEVTKTNPSVAESKLSTDYSNVPASLVLIDKPGFFFPSYIKSRQQPRHFHRRGRLRVFPWL